MYQTKTYSLKNPTVEAIQFDGSKEMALYFHNTYNNFWIDVSSNLHYFNEIKSVRVEKGDYLIFDGLGFTLSPQKEFENKYKL